MRKLKVFIQYVFLSLSLIALHAASALSQTEALERVSDGSISVPVYEFAGIEPMLSSRSDTTFVVNFWATWCAPCVKELPYFDEITKKSDGRAVKVLLVSLDFRKQLATRLLPFLKERGIQSEVIVLDDPDANAWIDKVHPSWSGAIPATLVFRGDRREFREQTFTRDELFHLVQSFME